MPSKQTARNSGTCPVYQPPRIDSRFLFLTTGLAAIWLALFPITAIGGRVVLAVYGLTFLFGCNRTRRAVLFVLPAMYLPYVWLVWDGTPEQWRDYHWYWVGLVWQLPGLLAEAAVHPLSETWFQTVTSLATLVFFFSVVMLARLSKKLSIVTSLLVLGASVVNSLIAYGLYRA